MSDVKRAGREALRMPDDYPGPLRQGTSSSDQNRFWFVRAQSWSEGAGVDSYKAIANENEECLRRAQVPYQDYTPGPQAWPDDYEPGSTDERYSRVAKTEINRQRGEKTKVEKTVR